MTERPLTLDRRLVLFLACAVLAALLGFVVISPAQALTLVTYGGYWAVLIIVVLFVRSLFRIGCASWTGWEDWKSRPRWPAALIAAGGVVLLVQETFGFKILMDEVMLLGTSMSMHLDKTALVPMRGHNIQGLFQLMAGQIDKRPLFQPFLVSIIHDITGYRPENVFFLNAVLTFVLLTLSYVTGFRIGGRGAGALAVLLLTSLPLLAQNATGGGFELLNLVMIAGTLLLAMRYLKLRDTDSLEAMGLSAILLAQTRYESVLFLLPVGLAVLWVWWGERRPALTWVVCAMPLMMLPYVLHNKVFDARQSSWELASKAGFDRPFSLSYIGDNIPHDLNFFFNPDGTQSNSLTLSILGFLALPFFVLWAAKTLGRLHRAPPARAALALFALGLAAHALLMLCYFWGRFDDPVIRRLSLPFNFTLVLAVVTAAAEMDWRGKIWPALALVTGAGLFAHSLPSMARHSYSLEYYVGREMEWRREFIAAHPERDYLFIDPDSISWITHLVSATPTAQALHNKDNIVFNFRNHIFSAIYVFQRLEVDPATGQTSVPTEFDPGPDYQLEPVEERHFTPLHLSRISRVVAIREGPATPPAPTAPRKMTPEEWEKARLEFYNNFLKRLP